MPVDFTASWDRLALATRRWSWGLTRSDVVVALGQRSLSRSALARIRLLTQRGSVLTVFTWTLDAPLSFAFAPLPSRLGLRLCAARMKTRWVKLFNALIYSRGFCIVWDGLGSLFGPAGEASDDFFLDDTVTRAELGHFFGISEAYFIEK